MIPLAKAQKFAERVVEQLRPHCKRIEIAGSIRRLRPQVSDVDLVIEATDRRAIEALVIERCPKFDKVGPQYVVATTTLGGVQLDLWFSYTPEPHQQYDFFPNPDRKPNNFGSLLLCRTGSTLHNITLCEQAKKLGMAWNPHWGVYREGVCIASDTEEDIYRALKLPFLPPEERELATRIEQIRFMQGGRVL